MCDISVCRRCGAAMEVSNLMTPPVAAFKSVLGRWPTEEEARKPAICREHGQSRLVPRFPLDLVLAVIRAHETREQRQTMPAEIERSPLAFDWRADETYPSFMQWE